MDITTFILSVAAGVVANFVYKWLGGWFKDSKHQKNDPPFERLQLSEGGCSFFVSPMCELPHSLSSVYAKSRKSQAERRKFTVPALLTAS